MVIKLLLIKNIEKSIKTMPQTSTSVSSTMYIHWAILLFSVATVYSQSCLKNPNVGRWVSLQSSATLPSGGLIAGFQDSPKTDLYLCRVAGFVGKYYQPDRRCYAENSAGVEVANTNYEVITNAGNVVWIPVSNKQLPCNIFQTGGTSAAPTYTGRAVYNNYLLPGNIVNGIVRVPWGGMHQYDSFEALTAVPQSLTTNPSKSSDILGTFGNSFTFRVKSEEEIHIDFGVNHITQFSVTIGGLTNLISGIGTFCNPWINFVNTAGVLSSTEYRGFWIRWITLNTLEVGVEGNVTPLVTYTAVGISNINSVVLSSYTKTTYWQIADLPRWNGNQFV